jgi:hypothetical protein
MENNFEMKTKTAQIKDFFKSWQFWKPFLAFTIGGFAGFLYYYFVGCKSGSCAITGNPYASIIWGGLLGLFVVSSPCARGRC